jgi:hypothetical protein
VTEERPLSSMSWATSDDLGVSIDSSGKNQQHRAILRDARKGGNSVEPHLPTSKTVWNRKEAENEPSCAVVADPTTTPFLPVQGELFLNFPIFRIVPSNEL